MDDTSKSAQIRELRATAEMTRVQIQDLFKDIGALQAWRRNFHAVLGQIKGTLMTIREDLAKLRTEVDETKTVAAGAAATVGGLSQVVKDLQARIDANPDMTSEEISAELGSLAAELDSSQSSLSAAIANVPQATRDAGDAAVKSAADKAAERAEAEGNATLNQPNAPRE